VESIRFRGAARHGWKPGSLGLSPRSPGTPEIRDAGASESRCAGTATRASFHPRTKIAPVAPCLYNGSCLGFADDSPSPGSSWNSAAARRRRGPDPGVPAPRRRDHSGVRRAASRLAMQGYERPPMSDSPVLPGSAVTPEAPWLGLRSFTEEAQAYFFG